MDTEIDSEPFLISVFGISCYRQISASQVVNKTEENMRGVQKSVCALSRLPLYGHIQVFYQLFIVK